MPAASDGIRQTLRDARDCGVVVGAHPGYPDREHFGRREREIASEAVQNLILEQVSTLNELAAEASVPVRFLKPHGALYNQAQRQPRSPEALSRRPSGWASRSWGNRIRCSSTWPQPQASATSRKASPTDDTATMARSSHAASRVPYSRIPTRWKPSCFALVADGRVATLCIHGDDPRRRQRRARPPAPRGARNPDPEFSERRGIVVEGMHGNPGP